MLGFDDCTGRIARRSGLRAGQCHRLIDTGRGWLSALLALLLVATPVSSAHAQDTVAVAPVDAFGPILVDPSSWALYRWDGDLSGWSNCSGQCAAAWPPYTIDNDPTGPASLAGSLGLLEREDSSWQVTYEGWPLYYFSRDTQPGAALGEGSTAFGARWYVVRLGQPEPAAAPLPPPPPSFPMPPSLPAFTPPEPPALPPVFSPPPSVPPALAQSSGVSIVDFEFRPSTVNIQVGNTVAWTNNGSMPHTATGDTGLWDTRLLARGQSGSHTFSSAGTFGYQCAIHPQMRGTVNVATAGALGQPSLQIPGYTPPTTTGYPPGFSPSPPSFTPPGVQYPIGSPGFPIGGQFTTLTVTAPPTGTVGLMWQASPAAQSYRIYQATVQQPFGLQVVQTVSQSLGVLVTHLTLAGLAPGTTYLLQVRAVDANGQEIAVPAAADAGPGAFFNPIPGTPTGLDVTATTSTTATLSWTGAAGAAAYQVFQATSPNGPFVQVAVTNSTTTTVTISGLTANTTYYFQVRAVEADGDLSLPSNTASVTVGSLLAAPTSLTVIATTGTTASLTWAASTGAAAYRVFQALTAAGPFTQSTVTFSALTTGVVTGLTPNTTYSFQVRAVDLGGNQSPPSNTVTATTALFGP